MNDESQPSDSSGQFLVKTIPALFGLLMGVAWMAWGLSHTLAPRNAGLGAGAFPLYGGALLCVLSLLCLYESRGSASIPEEGEPDEGPGVQMPIPPVARVVLIVVLLIFWAVVAEPLGFILSASLFCAAAMYVGGERTVLGVILSILAALVLSYIFSQILHVALPNGVVEAWIYP